MHMCLAFPRRLLPASSLWFFLTSHGRGRNQIAGDRWDTVKEQ